MHVGENEDFKTKTDMEVDDSVLQDLANNWMTPKLRTLIKCEADRCKTMMIFGLEEDRIPVKEERWREEILYKRLLEAIEYRHTRCYF